MGWMRVGSEDRDIAVLYIQITYALQNKLNKILLI